jgi:ferredoxin/flavodoxin
MKTEIFYFSATGNSLAVAEDIAAQLPEVQIRAIPKAINEDIVINSDNLGIVFPVYFVGMPRIVINFIQKITSSKAKYIFAVCTSGSPFPGGTLLQAQQELKAKGLTLNSGFSIQMPGNYIVKYGAFSPRHQERLFNKEKKKVAAISQMILNQQDHKIEGNNSLINWVGNLAYQSMFPKFPTLDRNFTVNENCRRCGICEKVCPVQNIQMTDGKPHWQGNCEHCLACIQLCPAEAIQYGNKTVNRKRYHHPEVQVGELYRED